MKLRRFLAISAVCGVLGMPAVAGAAAADEETPTHDARTEGYEQKVQLEKSSTALAWFVLAPLALVTLGVLFKDAKRSHLD
jgi:hypothetical protein